MHRMRWIGSMLLLASAACGLDRPEQRLIIEAAEALGSRPRILIVKTLALEGEGTQYNLGQDMRPGASGQTFSVTALRRVVDVTGGKLRVELTRTPNFAYFQGPAPQRQVSGVDGSVVYTVAANGTATRTAGQTALDRRVDVYHHPITALHAALAPGASVSGARFYGPGSALDVTTADGLRFTLVVDGTTHLPAQVESKSYHPNLGDVTLSTHFAEYEEVDGLQLPKRITTKVDDFTTAEMRYTTQVVDGDVGDLAAPAAAAAAPSAAPPPQANVVAEALGPGVWLLAGQSHHSALVEFADHLMLIDAPQSEARTLAVIAKARELVPGKPLTQVVTTHHHFDHTAGIRAAVAEGLAVITHSGNRAFVEEMAGRPHTTVSDALARKPQPVRVETVDTERVLEDKTMRVVLYHVEGNPHSDTMLMAYIPSARVVVQVDAFSPGSAVNPYAANLLENITRRKLTVDRVVPLHGTVAPMADLEKVASASS